MAESQPVDYSDWVGREEAATQRIDPHAVAALAATLDLEHAPAPGDPLPPGWQWIFFNPVARQSALAEDGHPRRGGFLPPIELPRRMWAGSRIRYLSALAVGAQATRTSRILSVSAKSGRAGQLCFVTVQHRIASDGRECIAEDQDIVYRAAPAPQAAPAPAPAPVEAIPVQWQHRILPDSRLLFRYSALTFNGHRIHYDLPYARESEGYRGLLVHGPLTATLLQQFALGCQPGRDLAQFDFRGVNPLFAGEAVQLQAWVAAGADALSLRALDAQGALAMQATAFWASGAAKSP